MSRRHYRRYSPVEQTREVITDSLLAAAQAASESRNQLNYAWISDCGPGAAQRQVDHYTRLIQLVGEADKAWRAVAAARGEEYRPCVDCGWLARYQEALEVWRRRAQREASSGSWSYSDE